MGYQQWCYAPKTQGESRLLPPSPFGEGTGERLCRGCAQAVPGAFQACDGSCF